MQDIELRDLLVLARAEIPDPQSELKTLYGWRYEYLSTAAKAIVGAGASLLFAVIAAALQHEKGTSWLPDVLGAVGAVVVLGIGITSYRRVRRIYREYVVAQELLSDAITLRPFLRLYRGLDH